MTIHAFQRSLEQKHQQNWGRKAPVLTLPSCCGGFRGRNRPGSLPMPPTPAPRVWQSRAEDALTRLRNGEPLQYLLGEWEFYGLTLAVGPGVLIPRADTETVVDACLERLTPAPGPVIWDLCSGSGAIALALASCRPDARILAAELCMKHSSTCAGTSPP